MNDDAFNALLIQLRDDLDAVECGLRSIERDMILTVEWLLIVEQNRPTREDIRVQRLRAQRLLAHLDGV